MSSTVRGFERWRLSSCRDGPGPAWLPVPEGGGLSPEQGRPPEGGRPPEEGRAPERGGLPDKGRLSTEPIPSTAAAADRNTGEPVGKRSRKLPGTAANGSRPLPVRRSPLGGLGEAKCCPPEPLLLQLLP